MQISCSIVRRCCLRVGRSRSAPRPRSPLSASASDIAPPAFWASLSNRPPGTSIIFRSADSRTLQTIPLADSPCALRPVMLLFSAICFITTLLSFLLCFSNSLPGQFAFLISSQLQLIFVGLLSFFPKNTCSFI